METSDSDWRPVIPPLVLLSTSLLPIVLDQDKVTDRERPNDAGMVCARSHPEAAGPRGGNPVPATSESRLGPPRVSLDG